MPSVWIQWGSKGWRDKDDPWHEYEFPTEMELQAFITGVEEAIGWMDYDIKYKPEEGDICDDECVCGQCLHHDSYWKEREDES